MPSTPMVQATSKACGNDGSAGTFFTATTATSKYPTASKPPPSALKSLAGVGLVAGRPSFIALPRCGVCKLADRT